MDRVRVEVIDGINDEVIGLLRGFFRGLGEERRTFLTTFDEVLRSGAMVVARVDGEVVGLTGVFRRYLVFPFRFTVVKRGFQGRGVGKALYDGQLPRLRSYFCVFSMFHNDNRPMVEWSRERGDLEVYRGDYFTLVCNSRDPRRAWLFARALRPFMPLVSRLLAIRDAVLP